MATKKYRLGVDVGGTHTDLVLLDVADGSLAVEKVATTPKNPALGIMRGIGNFAARGVDLSGIEFFSHGTTITTNALLEMRGAKVGLFINRGFRAIQETQGQARDGNVFDYFFQKPPPIAPQSLTREIGGRIDYAGAVLEPLDEDAVRRAAAELKAAGVVSIAVCYLFAFMNAAHEERTGAIIREIFSSLFQNYPGIKRLGWIVFRGAAAVLLLVAIVVVARAPQDGTFQILSRVHLLDLGVSVV